MKYAVVFLLVLISGVSLAQREPTDFGKVTVDDFNVNDFPEASSVVLFDVARLYYDHNLPPERERHIRVKINTREGFRKWGDFVLGNKLIKIKKIRAATYYLENGKVRSVELDNRDIIKERGSVKIFSLQNLQPGCIVEIAFTTVYLSHNVSPDWVIQNSVPVLWSEYILAGTRPLVNLIYGGISPAILDEKYKGTTTRWVFKNVPAFVAEPHMGPPEDYYARMEFYPPDNHWGTVSQVFLDLHYWNNERVPNRRIRKMAEDLTIGITDDLEKVKKLTLFMKEEFRWNGFNHFYPGDLNEFLEKKEGVSGDLNVVLSMMLKELGLNPTMILLSTRSNGQIIKDVPSIWQFNSIITSVRIGDKRYFLDATDPLLPFGVLPADCANVEGLELVGSSVNWIMLAPAQADKVIVTARLTIEQDQSLKGRISVVSNGYAGRDRRREYLDFGEQKFIKNNVATHKWDIDSVRILNHNKIDVPLQEKYFATIPGQIHGNQDRFYLDPYIMLVDRENIWKDQKRNYPIDLLIPNEKTLVLTLTIPDGYRVETLPENESISTPDHSMSCNFNFRHSNNVVIVTYQLVMSRTHYTNQEYPQVRDFYNQVITKLNDLIVISKAGID